MDIQHLPGKDNIVADCISRSTVKAVSHGIDYTAMAVAQIEDEDEQAYPTAITNLQLKDMPVYPNGPELLCDREVCVTRSKETGKPVAK